jgi:hypothetical protein
MTKRWSWRCLGESFVLLVVGPWDATIVSTSGFLIPTANISRISKRRMQTKDTPLDLPRFPSVCKLLDEPQTGRLLMRTSFDFLSEPIWPRSRILRDHHSQLFNSWSPRINWRLYCAQLDIDIDKILAVVKENLPESYSSRSRSWDR